VKSKYNLISYKNDIKIKIFVLIDIIKTIEVFIYKVAMSFANKLLVSNTRYLSKIFSINST